jgi:hypothetical protein
MYRGFDLDLEKTDLSDFVAGGRAQFDKYKQLAEADLDRYISVDGVVDGGTLEKDWFPNITADVFISHSHDNLDMAIGFGGSPILSSFVKTDLEALIDGSEPLVGKKVLATLQQEKVA